ncbi:hypothetical protein N2152v2_009659 [Parachlorella kessleri]
MAKVPLEPLILPVMGSAALVGALASTASWLMGGRQHPKERGLLSGCSVGAALALSAYPVVEAAFGQGGLRLALLWGAVNNVAVCVASFLLFASAGAAFPEQYEHVDGGRYRGEWKGMLKEGLGVYTYPSGARYEGEWVDNAKEGRGVYHFPRGGVYEGEWRAGKQEGLGVRTFASGKAGMWREGRLETPMEERQCSLAVEGSNEAAAAARRVQVGAGGVPAAARALLMEPATWAYVAAGALAVLGRQLTPTLDALTRQLAIAHAPLALLALGLTLDTQPPQSRQLRDVTAVMAMRLLPPLLLALAAAAVLGGPLRWPAAQVAALVGPLLVCGVAPVAPQVQGYAYRFRLNENLAAALIRTSTLAALLLAPLVAAASALAAWTGSLRPLLLVAAAAAASTALAAATAPRQRQQPLPGASPGGPRPSLRQAAAPAAAPSVVEGKASGDQQQEQDRPPKGKVRMVYSGQGATEEGSGEQPQSPSLEQQQGEPPAAGQQQEQQQPQQAKRGSAFEDVDEPSAAAGGSMGDGHGNGGATSAGGAGS